MHENPYPYKRPITETRYDFLSISQEKEVVKRIIFTTSDYQNLYNLALVDVLEDGTISDITETKNKDMRRVLATVINVIDEFLCKYPENIIAFKGSDERRQRLYRLVISRDLAEIQKKFVILGICENGLSEPFQKNNSYGYFIILKS